MRGCDVSERITEVDLTTIERWADRLEELPSELALIWEPPPAGMRGFRSLVAEVRRLRGLILAATEHLNGEIAITMVTGWGEGENALMAEARTIREEQG